MLHLLNARLSPEEQGCIRRLFSMVNMQFPTLMRHCHCDKISWILNKSLNKVYYLLFGRFSERNKQIKASINYLPGNTAQTETLIEQNYLTHALNKSSCLKEPSQGLQLWPAGLNSIAFLFCFSCDNLKSTSIKMSRNDLQMLIYTED